MGEGGGASERSDEGARGSVAGEDRRGDVGLNVGGAELEQGAV